MSKKAIVELKILVPNIIVYLLLNYLPWSTWMGEIGSLAFKLAAYLLMSIELLYLKKRFKLELKRSIKPISLISLLPLTLIWFVHPLYALLFDGELTLEHLEASILLLDIFGDLFLAIVEDVLFVEIALCFLHHLLYKLNQKRFVSILIAANFFVLCHSYTFLNFAQEKAWPIQVANFFLIVECAYLATYFEDSWLPVFFHLMFNELNIVVFDQVYVIEYGWRYDMFIFLIFFLTCFYLAAVYQLSRLTDSLAIADARKNHSQYKLAHSPFKVRPRNIAHERRIFVATGNKGKIKEYADMLTPLGYVIFTPKDLYIEIDIDENGSSYQENSIIKAKGYASLVRMPVIADDSGFEIEGLDNFPGIISARFADSLGGDYKKAGEKLNKMLGNNENRHARFVCCITYLENRDAEPICFNQTVEGSFLKDPKGKEGFGYDPYFHYDAGNLDFGIISEEEKNKFSHRGKALKELLRYLSNKPKGDQKS